MFSQFPRSPLNHTAKRSVLDGVEISCDCTVMIRSGGRMKKAEVPCPGIERISSFPLWASATAMAIGQPRPGPPCPDWAPSLNGVSLCAMKSGCIPWPLSDTSTATRPSGKALAEIRTTSPRGECATAFLIS